MVMSDQSKIQFRQNAVLALRSFVEGRKAYYTDDVKITAQNYQDKKHFDHLCLLIEEIEYLEKELGNQDEVLQMIRNWCEAYPIDIFTKPDYELCHKTLKTVGQTVDAISADCQRHLLSTIAERISVLDTENKG